jgi:glucose-6-phosphate 1-epimerase
MIHRSSRQGIQTLLVDTPLARCEISLLGAQVLSFVPKHDGRDLLWCSDARRAPGGPIRGGIPVCWPWFSRQGVAPSAPQHGFVRKLPWRVVSASERGDDVDVLLVPDEAAFAAAVGQLAASGGVQWPAGCTPSLTVSIGRELCVTVNTDNRSDRSVGITQALHTYFRVGNVANVGLEGLQGLSYLDKVAGFAESVQSGPWSFDSQCDRIYLRSGSCLAIVDPVLGRRIDIGSQRSSSTVVWNPGADGVLAFDDIPAGDWFHYLCVEAANCGPLDALSIEPGGQATLAQRLAVSD